MVAFTAADGQPEVYSTATGTLSQGLATPPEVAPAAPASPGNPLVAAFKAYISAVWANSDPTVTFGTGAHLAPGTTPSVATVP
jgi:hypothetical protein